MEGGVIEIKHFFWKMNTMRSKCAHLQKKIAVIHPFGNSEKASVIFCL